MTITSLSFFGFVALTLLLYYIALKQKRWFLLLVASIFFFVASCGWKMLIYLFFGIGLCFFSAKQIAKTEDPKKKKQILFVSIVLLLLELAGLKYLSFFTTLSNIFSDLFNVQWYMGEINILAPIGISYYTLSVIGYLTDVYRGELKPQENCFKMALFVSYFPQMVSGPIVRYSEMNKTLYQGNEFDYNNVKSAFMRIVWGLFKKMVIADRLAIVVSSVFSNTGQFGGFYIAVTTIAFAFQLYADFSGCMDVVLGVSQAFGVKLPENFRQPYFSESLSEFWRRWHITLGSWVKDYILYPLLKSNRFQSISKKLKKKYGKKVGRNLPTIIGLFFVWSFIGLWHGGSFKFIFASGLIHWFWISSGMVLSGFFEKVNEFFKFDTECFSFKLFRKVRTFLTLCIGFIFICSQSFVDGLRSTYRMIKTFNPWVVSLGNLGSFGINIYDFVLILVGLLLILLVSIKKEQGMEIRKWVLSQNIPFQWIVLLGGIFAVIIFGVYGPGYDASTFIYGGF